MTGRGRMRTKFFAGALLIALTLTPANRGVSGESSVLGLRQVAVSPSNASVLVGLKPSLVPMPDSVVSALVGPASVAAGARYALTYTVRNVGPGPATQPSLLGFFLSADATITTDDVLLGTVAVPALNPSAQTTGSVQVVVPG